MSGKKEPRRHEDAVHANPSIEDVEKGERPDTITLYSERTGGVSGELQSYTSVWHPVYKSEHEQYVGDIVFDIRESHRNDGLNESKLLPRDIPTSHYYTMCKIGLILFPDSGSKYRRVRPYGSRHMDVIPPITVLTATHPERGAFSFVFESKMDADLWVALRSLHRQPPKDVEIHDMKVRDASISVFKKNPGPTKLIEQARETSIMNLFTVYSLLDDIRRGERARELLAGLDANERDEWLKRAWKMYDREGERMPKV